MGMILNTEIRVPIKKMFPLGIYSTLPVISFTRSEEVVLTMFSPIAEFNDFFTDS